jgi:amidophosphoribosyltransferase
MARQEEFIAHRMSVARICKHVGADSLGYLSLPNTVKAVGIGKDKFCRACFDSKYPCPIPEAYKITKLDLEQLRP